MPVGLPVPVRIGVFGSAYTSQVPGQPGGANNALAGTGDVAASDAPFGAGKGYIFDAVLAAGGTVRNYGFLTLNVGPITVNGQPVTNAGAAGIQQVVPLNPTMFQPGITDAYFRGYDNAYPDVYRFNEWKCEFGHFQTSYLKARPHRVQFQTANSASVAVGATSKSWSQLASPTLARTECGQ